MAPPASELVLSTSPFVRSGLSTVRIMREVLACALVMLVAAVWTFGVGALLTVAMCTAGAVGTEWLSTRGRAKSTVADTSAVLTGVLLGLTLPPSLPLWMALLGGVVGVGLGKVVFGGLGENPFNPALVGRAFLQAAFPTALTTWVPPLEGKLTSLHPALFAPPLAKAVDGVSAATPLGAMKFEHTITPAGDLFWGGVAGSLGETSAVLLVVIGVWMGVRGLFDWRLPVSTLLSVAVCSGALFLLDPAAYPSPAFMVLSGGLLFGAVFMVTDPVTTPTSPRGAWLFGLGVGVLVVVIRVFGGMAEGVMYAILLMNALTPHLDQLARPRTFGARRSGSFRWPSSR